MINANFRCMAVFGNFIPRLKGTEAGTHVSRITSNFVHFTLIFITKNHISGGRSSNHAGRIKMQKCSLLLLGLPPLMLLTNWSSVGHQCCLRLKTTNSHETLNGPRRCKSPKNVLIDEFHSFYKVESKEVGEYSQVGRKRRVWGRKSGGHDSGGYEKPKKSIRVRGLLVTCTTFISQSDMW